MTTRSSFLRLHRWVSLAVAAFWLVQAATGLLIVFHWEIDDLTVAGRHRPTDLAAIDRAAARIAAANPAAEVTSIWNTAGRPDRYDMFVEGEPGAVVTVNGAGETLRVRADDEMWARGGWIDTLVSLHHDLLGGEFGSWIVGISGLLLLTNLMLGIILAWPGGRGLARAVRPVNRGPPAARRFSWHRAIGLWGAIPAMLAVGAGVLLVFHDGVEDFLAPTPWTIAERPSARPVSISMPAAARVALNRYPDARISGISYPSRENAVYRFRLRQPGEAARAYGQTTVFVDAVDGRVVGDFDALRAPPARSFVNGLFAFHTGEIAGTIGRIAAALIGVWLITMIVTGIRLWLARLRRR